MAVLRADYWLYTQYYSRWGSSDPKGWHGSKMGQPRKGKHHPHCIITQAPQTVSELEPGTKFAWFCAQPRDPVGPELRPSWGREQKGSVSQDRAQLSM